MALSREYRKKNTMAVFERERGRGFALLAPVGPEHCCFDLLALVEGTRLLLLPTLLLSCQSPSSFVSCLLKVRTDLNASRHADESAVAGVVLLTRGACT